MIFHSESQNVSYWIATLFQLLDYPDLVRVLLVDEDDPDAARLVDQPVKVVLSVKEGTALIISAIPPQRNTTYEQE